MEIVKLDGVHLSGVPYNWTVSIYRVYRTTEGGSKCCIETLQVIKILKFPVWDSIEKNEATRRCHFFASRQTFWNFPPNILKYSYVSNFSEKTRRLHKLILLPWFKKKCLTLAKKLKLMFRINIKSEIFW